MGWEGFNLGLMEGADFSIKAKHLVLEVFDQANEGLSRGFKTYSEATNKQISEAYKMGDVAAGDIMSQEKYWESGLHQQRLASIGVLALDWLMSSLKGALQGASNYLNASHPGKGPYKGDGWLAKLQGEYYERFGIDFTRGPVDVCHIQELVLARNAGIHRDLEGPLEEYLAKVNRPSFIESGEDGKEFVFVTRNALVAIIDDAEKFVDWVVSEIEKLRPENAPQKA